MYNIENPMQQAKKKIDEYFASQFPHMRETNEGYISALRDFGIIDNEQWFELMRYILANIPAKTAKK